MRRPIAYNIKIEGKKWYAIDEIERSEIEFNSNIILPEILDIERYWAAEF